MILAGAAALRIVGISYGHPFPLFSPDERNIVPRAWQMVHGGGLDPHWFDYPSLLMYLLAPFQAWEGAPSYLAARVVVLVLALGAIVAAWWLAHSTAIEPLPAPTSQTSVPRVGRIIASIRARTSRLVTDRSPRR